ncbi:MAG TPA: glutathione binding-like protein [Polyangiaceae bacterium]|nr:glutathione binding-like protein [Polyangiaceae bacterium]
MAIRVYGHPWSINTRKVLAVLAEKNQEAELVLVMVPKGEHKGAQHVARHPFGKVPALEHDGFLLYETRAINHYLNRVLPGAALVPEDARAAARVEQWLGVAESYFIPHVHPLLVESLFRRFLGGEQNAAVIEAGRKGMAAALDAADQRLGSSPYLAGEAFSLADIHWMPYLEYLVRTGEPQHISGRKHLAEWWNRVGERPSWQRVARSGPQAYERGMTAAVIEKLYRR